MRRTLAIIFKNRQMAKASKRSVNYADRGLKIAEVLTAALFLNSSIACTTANRPQEQIQERQANQANSDRMQIVSNSERHSKLQILLPLYIYPNWYDKKNYIWQQAIAAAKQVPIVAIINPNNGPDRAPPNTDYQQGIRDLHQAGIKAIGYVPTNYAKRDLQAVKADIDLYIKYFDIEGIFIDEATSKPDKVGYYQQIYQYVKSHSTPDSYHQPSYLTIINPGVTVDEGYLSQAVADTIVVFENNRQSWTKYRPPTYFKKYAAQHFAALIHTTANKKLMKSTLDRVAKSQFGYVYITNDSTETADRNPWDTLPTYWQAEVNYIQQLNKIE
jgi:Spherulation-specific family 4